ncbi:MAG: M48 family metalloprotease [Pyrinomonadaceae bacterium]|nr:M48 family metalloprotease [Pyrinomonadaceae bacterium]
MRNQFLRTASSLTIVASLMSSFVSPSLVVMAQTAQTEQKPATTQPAQTATQTTQTTAQTTETTAKSKKDKKKDKKAQAAKAGDMTASKPVNGKTPLSVNEDPAMIGKRNINKGFGGWLGGSQSKEVSLGRQYSAEIERQLKLVNDPLITEYVNRVGQNIVNHSDAKVPFTIKVVDSDEVNAFALPGGYFYVNKGLILAADNESELAGVMAHEIGHVAARHVVESNGKQNAIGLGILAGTILTGGIAGQLLYNTQGLLQGLLGSQFSRDAEREADRLGVQYMYAAGYDPNGMTTMFEKLMAQDKRPKGKKPGTITKLFSTHPQTTDRRGASLNLISRFPENEEYVLSTSEFQRVKAHLFRISNAKASIKGDVDEEERNGRPTLKRRQQGDETTTTTGSSDSTSTGTSDSTPSKSDTTTTTTSTDSKPDSDKTPPKLKRRGEEPTTQPTPNR